MPFEFTQDDNRKSLSLSGDEIVSIHGLEGITPLSSVDCEILYLDGNIKIIRLKCRIDTALEVEYIEHEGVLNYVLRNLAKASQIYCEKVKLFLT